MDGDLATCSPGRQGIQVPLLQVLIRRQASFQHPAPRAVFPLICLYPELPQTRRGDPNLGPSSPTWLTTGFTWKLVFLRKKNACIPILDHSSKFSRTKRGPGSVLGESLGLAAAQSDLRPRRCCGPRVTGEAPVHRSRCFSETHEEPVRSLSWKGWQRPGPRVSGLTIESKASGPMKQTGDWGEIEARRHKPSFIQDDCNQGCKGGPRCHRPRAYLQVHGDCAVTQPNHRPLKSL